MCMNYIGPFHSGNLTLRRSFLHCLHVLRRRLWSVMWSYGNAPMDCGRFAVPRERLDCSALLPDSQGRFGCFYAHFLRRSRQRNTESRNTAFVFSKFCFCCYRKNEFRQFFLWNLTVYWISSPMISLSSLTRATSVFRRYEPCMAATVPEKPIL